MIQRFLFGLFYRIGFTPWEGHKLSRALSSLAQKPGKLLDIGCGTGDTTIDLAQKGWQATGVDFVEKALQRARKKAAAAKVEVRFLRGDATKLSSLGLGADFDLVTDNGCMHLLDDAGRDAWAREVTAVTAPGAHLLVVGFPPGNRPGPKGFDQAEIERRLPAWKLVDSGAEDWSNPQGETLHYYHLEKC
jgi:ubiquinone/menaquinone biosynthesis C-methylase UbiE